MLKTPYKIAHLAMLVCAMTSQMASAQVKNIDPNAAGDLAPVPQTEADYGTAVSAQSSAAPAPDAATSTQSASAAPVTSNTTSSTTTQASGTAETIGTQSNSTFKKGDLIDAAEGVFGKGAEGVAGMIEKILKDQGEPSAYITGSEASGAFVVGLRYGSGMLHHKVEGDRKVYWTGPSIGFDVGGNASKTFVLVYNLFDSQDLYKRFPQGEGAGYFIGGLTASYLRWGNIVVIPIRVGAGLRLGVNAGYMKFREKGSWIPF